MKRKITFFARGAKWDLFEANGELTFAGDASSPCSDIIADNANEPNPQPA
jgi:hypothetical protein|tara:strand:- start:224 stop:373 length:150 start_codon:yes stop_codon:yes gene_type:complete